MNRTYRVNEIFYSLQGEGRWAGRAAVFVRFSGCNLRCPFCDTDFREGREMTAGDIVTEVLRIGGKCRFLVFTGGEPTLQLDSQLVEAMHSEGFYVTIETNGTHEYPADVDWVTLSPKDSFTPNGSVVISKADELKLVFDGKHRVGEFPVEVTYRYLQPCDVGDAKKNKEILAACVEYIELNPEWQLSLQQHKILNIQ